MKIKIFNVVVYSMLGWSILSATYLALPIEYQEMIPQFNWLTALISGGSTALLGTGGLAVKTWLTNAKVQSDEKYNVLANKFMQLVAFYDEAKVAYNELTTKYDMLDKSIRYNSKLLSIDLQTKLDNPLITETARNLIEGIANEKEE